MTGKARGKADREGVSLLRWRDVDTRHGVTKSTVVKAAAHLGLSETQLIHEAVASYIARELPQYEVDFDALTQSDLRAIRKRVPQSRSGTVLSSLIP